MRHGRPGDELDRALERAIRGWGWVAAFCIAVLVLMVAGLICVLVGKCG